MTDAAAAQAGGPTFADLRRYYRSRLAMSRAIVVLPEHGCVYVKNQKAGCSTMTLWLDRVHTGEHDFMTQRVHRDNRLPKPKDVGWPEVVRMLAGGAFRFSFVREPLARARSTWYAKVVRQQHYRAGLQEVLGLPVDPESPLTFEQFVTAIEQQDPLTEMDPHWRPQHVNLLHPLVDYDHIGRLESFDADLAVIREHAGLPDVPVTIPNSRKDGQPDPYAGRPDLVRRVEALYAQDFELYGY
ncbi:sulfotransferase family protein [Nocardioides sp. TF02-7]|uniref:sulfotransferase family protein n=1 Tax=Nocardioides sp. TF02-7 TaxID=2917724 RepID=UPI001F0588E0|nr:sulfotransferase family protein [Nocardioides sp. TF02-7]UMG93057.1 sulfotransferase family protein [Nocardioides sp. TF02-7]